MLIYLTQLRKARHIPVKSLSAEFTSVRCVILINPVERRVIRCRIRSSGRVYRRNILSVIASVSVASERRCSGSSASRYAWPTNDTLKPHVIPGAIILCPSKVAIACMQRYHLRYSVYRTAQQFIIHENCLIKNCSNPL